MKPYNSIMIIDDDDVLCKSITHIFNEEGYDTETAKTGSEAIEKIRNKFFNIILLDVKLPDIEGTELLTPLKEMYPDTDVIIITGSTEINFAIKALNHGASGYALKPLNIEDLLIKIKNSVKKQHSIAEKRQMQRILKQSHEKRKELESIINKSPAVVFLRKSEEGWPIEYISENIEHFGYTPQEFYFEELMYSKIVHPNDLERIISEINLYSMEGAQEFKLEYRIITKKGMVCWIDDHTWIRRNKEGEITHYQGIIIDITKRKELEEILRNSEKSYRFICENANDLISILNENYQLEYLNKQIHHELLGYSKEELINKSILNYIHPDDLECSVKFFRELFRGGDEKIEVRLKNNLNNNLWLEIRGKAFVDSIGGKKILLVSRYISERKKAEQEIKLEYSKIEQIFNATIPLCLIDKNFNIICVNNSFSSIFNIKNSELTEKKCYEVIPGQLCDTPKCTIKQILGGKDYWEYEKDVKLSNGLEIICNMRAVPFRGADGEVIGVIQNYTDITNQKEAENAFQKSNNEISTLLDASKTLLKYSKFENSSSSIFDSCTSLIGNTDGFIGILTPDKKTIQLRFLYLRGFSRKIESSLSLSIEGFLLDIVRSKKVNYHNDFLDSDWRKYFSNNHIKLKNVMLVPLVINNVVKGLIGLGNKPGGFNENDKRIATAFAELVSIALMNSQALNSLKKSKQKYKNLSNELEQRVENRTKELKKSEEKIRTLINNISDVLMENDIDGTITYLSPQIYEIIGYRSKELIGSKFLKFIHPEDINLYEMIIKKPYKLGDVFTVEQRVKHKKGYYVPISMKGNLVQVNNEFKIFMVIRDITEEKLVDDMMKREIKKLKELDLIRNDLIKRISHELKTPLISIFSGSQYLLNHYVSKENDNIRDLIKFIHIGGYRLKSLVDNLIITYNIESKELPLNLKRENLISIIENCIDDIILQANKRKIFISINLHKELYLDVDKSRISQAISNILSNAVKNTPTSGNIFIKTFKHPKFVDIIIKDDGVGLTTRENSLIFKKFGKVERYGKGMDVDIEGAGLGLYISNEIVKLHNGEIIVKSKGRNKGSTFIIRLYLI